MPGPDVAAMPTWPHAQTTPIASCPIETRPNAS